MAVTAVVAEGALRMVDFPASDFSPWVAQPATGYGYAPLVETRFRREGEFDIAFRTNRDGLRDDDLLPSGGPRVLVLGDSFASGYGVERGQLFADLLESDLKVDVVNAAVGGYEIIHQVRYYETRGRDLQPDVVLLALYLANDVSRNDRWREAEDGTLVPVGHSLPVRTAHPPKLLALFEHALYGRRLNRLDARGEWEPFPDYVSICERVPSSETQARWNAVQRLLHRLDDLVVASNAKLIVASFSHRTANDPSARSRYLERHPGFLSRYDFSLPRERIAEITGTLGVELVDLDTAIAAHYAAAGEPLYFRRDGHWNAAGHRVAAAALAGSLRAALAQSNGGHGT